LLWSTLFVVGVTLLIPFTPLNIRLGFVPLTGLFFVTLIGFLGGYLGLVELAKRWFYSSDAPR
jgi:Mg2+-importing ATPase